MLESTCSWPSGALHTVGAVRRSSRGMRCRPVALRHARATACCASVRDPFGHHLMVCKARSDRERALNHPSLSFSTSEQELSATRPMIEILRKLRMRKFRMSKEQLKSLKIRTTQMCGCVSELLWMRALNPCKNTQFPPHAGCATPFSGGVEKACWLTRRRASPPLRPASARSAAARPRGVRRAARWQLATSRAVGERAPALSGDA